MSILGIDFGQKNIGLAISRSNLIANPLLTLTFDSSFWDKLKEIIKQEKVETIVVGIPYNLANRPTQQTREVLKFVETLKAKTKKKVFLENEVMSSKLSPDDQAAAALILNSWLEKT